MISFVIITILWGRNCNNFGFQIKNHEVNKWPAEGNPDSEKKLRKTWQKDKGSRVGTGALRIW